MARILLIDNNEDLPTYDAGAYPDIDAVASLKDTDSVEAADYSIIAVHMGNEEKSWAQRLLRRGQIDVLIIFSGGLGSLKHRGGRFELPRHLFKRRFQSFLDRLDAGARPRDAARVFLTENDAGSGGMSTLPDSPLPVLAVLKSDANIPSWCDEHVQVRTEEGDTGARVRISDTLDQLDNQPSHLLVLRDTYEQSGDGIELLLHLRLRAERDYSRWPVLVRTEESLQYWLRVNSHFAVLGTDGVRPVEEQERVEKVIGEMQGSDDGATPLSIDAHIGLLEDLAITPRGQTGRHNLANQWGPVQLWTGLQLLRDKDRTDSPHWIEERSATLRENPYYAYLLSLAYLRRQANQTQDTAEEDTKRERTSVRQKWLAYTRQHPIDIMLIDDEAASGWVDALEAIFEHPAHGNVNVPEIDIATASTGAIAQQVNTGSADIRLVDLRLQPSDANETSLHADRLSGVKLIQELKQSAPEVPVIAVTASNKAWTVRAVTEAGADGYWIKESPEYSADPTHTVENAADLLETLRVTTSRYNDAGPVWKLRDAIEDLRDDEDRCQTFPLREEEGIHAVRQRLLAIDDRLRRAFGYLVRQRSLYEIKSFRSAPVDLAYLTVWSIMNEVDALCFTGPDYQRSHQLHQTTGRKEYRFYDPADGTSKSYWVIEDGQVVSNVPKGVPPRIEKVIRPLDRNGQPVWPPLHADKERTRWMLLRAGASDLEKRFQESTSDRLSLRKLRNKLELAHGERNDVAHADLHDVHQLIMIWKSVLKLSET